MSMRMRAATVSVALVLAVVAGACGGGDVTVKGEGPAPQRPTGAGEVVIQILYSGGFVPLESSLSTVPPVTVLGDGTVIMPGPVPAIYPGPAITPLQAGTISASTVDALVAKAWSLGLLSGPLEFGRPLVADAGNTTITIVADGTAHRQVAYALEVSDVRGSPGVGDTERRNREALLEFRQAVDLAASGAGDREWTPSAIAVYVLGGYQAADPSLTQLPVVWPLSRTPSTEGERPCTLFDGDDAKALLQAVTKATGLTSWIIGGTARALAFRPVVPGQPGCG